MATQTFYDRHPECLSMSPEQLTFWLRVQEREIDDEVHAVRNKIGRLQWLTENAAKRNWRPDVTVTDLDLLLLTMKF